MGKNFHVSGQFFEVCFEFALHFEMPKNIIICITDFASQWPKYILLNNYFPLLINIHIV